MDLEALGVEAEITNRSSRSNSPFPSSSNRFEKITSDRKIERLELLERFELLERVKIP